MKDRFMNEQLPQALITDDDERLRLYPISAVAAIVDFSPEHILRLVRKQKIRGRQPARDWLVSLDDLLAYKQAPKGKPGRRRVTNVLIKFA